MMWAMKNDSNVCTYHTLGANRSSGTASPFGRFARARFKKMSESLPEIREPMTSPKPGEMNDKPIKLALNA